MGKRIKEIEVKCREVALNILQTMALHPKMLKCIPKAGQYEEIFAFSFLCWGSQAILIAFLSQCILTDILTGILLLCLSGILDFMEKIIGNKTFPSNQSTPSDLLNMSICSYCLYLEDW